MTRLPSVQPPTPIARLVLTIVLTAIAIRIEIVAMIGSSPSFASRALETAARVTQVVGDAERFGLALAIEDLKDVTAFLNQTLGGDS